jgi:hypothetical protein
MAFYKVSYQWLPLIDKHRYRPLPVSVDVLQNAFDLIFLLVFIFYWNWGPILILLYYLIETLVMSLFTCLKWWKSKIELFSDRLRSNSIIKSMAILILCTVIGVFSYAQISVAHNVLGMSMVFPTWNIIWLDEKQFMIGIAAIVLQQAMDYYKYQLQPKNTTSEWLTAMITPVSQIFFQQFAVMLGIVVMFTFAFVDLKVTSVMLALLIGGMKLVFGQLHIIILKK